VSQQLVRQLKTYQRVAMMIGRRRQAEQISNRTRTARLLQNLERSKVGTGVYLILCKLDMTISWLNRQAGDGESVGARLLCRDHTKLVDRVMSRLLQHVSHFTSERVPAKYITAVLSVTLKHLLQRSLHVFAGLRRSSHFLSQV